MWPDWDLSFVSVSVLAALSSFQCHGIWLAPYPPTPLQLYPEPPFDSFSLLQVHLFCLRLYLLHEEPEPAFSW